MEGEHSRSLRVSKSNGGGRKEGRLEKKESR